MKDKNGNVGVFEYSHAVALVNYPVKPQWSVSDENYKAKVTENGIEIVRKERNRKDTCSDNRCKNREGEGVAASEQA